MKVYLGVDVGTTNTKVVVVNQNGIEKIVSFKTPKIRSNGVEYFDLARIENNLAQILEQLLTEYMICGISCASFGESVVPVARGEKLHDPIVWYETCTKETQRKYGELVDKFAPYGISGVEDACHFSIYKILYMYEAGIVQPCQVEHWIPVSSYIPYKLTGKPLWDMTQACRTRMVDIHNRCWNKELLQHFNIAEDQLGKLAYTGSFVGYFREKIPIFLAGHDHVTGAFGLVNLYGSNVVFDSMGTASLILAVSSETEKELHLSAPFMRNRGIVGIAFEDGQYYLASGVKYYGKMIELVLKIAKVKFPSSEFNHINEKLKTMPQKVNFYIFCNGDNIVGESYQGINFFAMPPDCSTEMVLQSIYHYLCYTSRLTVESLFAYVGELPVILGGALVSNRVLMEYKASMMNRDLYYLETPELTALGAAIAAVRGANDQEFLKGLRTAMKFNVVHPDPQLARDMARVYEELKQGYEAFLQ